MICRGNNFTNVEKKEKGITFIYMKHTQMKLSYRKYTVHNRSHLTAALLPPSNQANINPLPFFIGAFKCEFIVFISTLKYISDCKVVKSQYSWNLRGLHKRWIQFKWGLLLCFQLMWYVFSFILRSRPTQDTSQRVSKHRGAEFDRVEYNDLNIKNPSEDCASECDSDQIISPLGWYHRHKRKPKYCSTLCHALL